MRTLLLIAGLTLAVLPLPAAEPADVPAGTIAFASLAPRGWDLYVTDTQTKQTRRLTDHPALDYNAAFSPDGRQIAFVSERDGNLELYVIGRDGGGLKRLTNDYALDDHPAWSPDGKRLAFVSTRQPSDTPGRAWNAVYVMNADGSGVERLSPANVADYSPAWSPKGDLLAVASGSGKTGGTDLYVTKPDGGGRRLVIKDGGWPAFSADGSALYFHSKRQGKWGIWRCNLDGSGLERITPAEVEAYTPRTAGGSLACAVKRGQHRQIELLDTATGKMTAVTDDATDHWNPSVSPDGKHVVYHKAVPGADVPNVELWGTPPDTRLQMLRLGGAFPSFAPDGKRLALTGGGFATIDVMNVDGSDRKTIYKGTFRGLFSTSWAHHGDRIAFSHGGVFQDPAGKVELLSLKPDGSDLKPITEEKGNNGFPSFSPDGKQLVFRSGRGGSKNLWIMNSDGTGARQLTDGKWTDTMCDWSPVSDWIAFASNRDGDFEVFLVKTDGTGLRKLIGGGGRNNHPHFSPDSKWIVFTSQRAGYSAEEISLPSQPQPYGDLFLIRTDGTGLRRLTHNGFEEGTPAWGPVLNVKPSSEGQKAGRDY
jgi:Tol biopolymer transport system component